MCDQTQSAKKLLAQATKMGLLSGKNAYGGIKSPSKRKGDLCATINQALGAGVQKRGAVSKNADKAVLRDAVVIATVDSSDNTLFAKESAITGPPITRKMCVDSDCSTTDHCTRSTFMSRCHLKEEYLQRFVEFMDDFAQPRETDPTLAAEESALPPVVARAVHNLKQVPVSDILHDMVKSNYFQLCDKARYEINGYVSEYFALRKYTYADKLALLYFVVIARDKLQQGIDPSTVFFVMVQPKSLAGKIAGMRSAERELKYDGTTSVSGKQKVVMASFAVALTLAGYAAGAHLTGNTGVLSAAWYQNILSSSKALPMAPGPAPEPAPGPAPGPAMSTDLALVVPPVTPYVRIAGLLDSREVVHQRHLAEVKQTGEQELAASETALQELQAAYNQKYWTMAGWFVTTTLSAASVVGSVAHSLGLDQGMRKGRAKGLNAGIQVSHTWAMEGAKLAAEKTAKIAEEQAKKYFRKGMSAGLKEAALKYAADADARIAAEAVRVASLKAFTDRADSLVNAASKVMQR